MGRKRRHEEHVNHEAWAIPYGDLITLLLAFFVVMYALSSVNEGKYRVLSDSLIAAFRAPPRSLDPVQVGELSRAFHSVQARQPRTLVPLEVESAFDAGLQTPEHGRGPGWDVMRTAGIAPEDVKLAAAQLEDLSAAIADALADLVASDLVRMRRSRFWLEIEINTSVLFPTGSVDLSADSLLIVERLGGILKETDTRVQVEGHTDTVPISTQVHPSNWELSAARAATVVRKLGAAGVEPSRMAAVGFGEFQPVADNLNAEGRARNRRVVLVVLAAGQDPLMRDAAGSELPSPQPRSANREQSPIPQATVSSEEITR